jgi:hypothetical protein
MRLLAETERRLVREALLAAAEQTARARTNVDIMTPPPGHTADSWRQAQLALLDTIEGTQRRLATEVGLGDVQIGALR